MAGAAAERAVGGRPECGFGVGDEPVRIRVIVNRRRETVGIFPAGVLTRAIAAANARRKWPAGQRREHGPDEPSPSERAERVGVRDRVGAADIEVMPHVEAAWPPVRGRVVGIVHDRGVRATAAVGRAILLPLPPRLFLLLFAPLPFVLPLPDLHPLVPHPPLL